MSIRIGHSSSAIRVGPELGAPIHVGASGGDIHVGASGGDIRVGAGGYAGLYSVQYDGAGETAQNAAADAQAPHNFPAGTIAIWVKTTDTSGTFLTWTDVPGNNRILLLLGAGQQARMFVEMNNDGGSINTTGTTVINDDTWHLIGLSWIWATGAQLYVDGVAEGALDVCADNWPGSPNMDDLSIAFSNLDGQIARAGMFHDAKGADWWAAAYATTRDPWRTAAHDLRMGDSPSDRPALVTIADVKGGLNLTTVGMDATNLISDHP